MATVITYGEGGFDPTKPNNNIVSSEEVPDEPEPVTLESLDEALSFLASEVLGMS